MEKVNTTTKNPLDEKIMILKDIFPECFSEGKLDIDKLKSLVGNNQLEENIGKYGLNWAGRTNAFQAIRVQSTGTLTPQPEESKNWDGTENLFIEGDNLEVLKLLQKYYREKIKMIYIDPPYNTGKDFVYKDNFTQGVADYYEQTGQTKNGIKMTANTEKNGRYHSDWLTMMYPRLFLARNLLKDDGVIFISIDDNEVANLRLLMDEIFGEENFITLFIWNKKNGRQNDAKFVSTNHEYVICYSKNYLSAKINLLPRTEVTDEEFSNPDSDVRGNWIHRPLHARSGSESAIYEIEFPNGVKWKPPVGTYPRFSKEKLLELYNDNRIWFGKDAKNVPRYKRFLTEVKQGIISNTLLLPNEVGTTQKAKQDYQDLMPEVNFDSPKSVELIKYLTILSTQTNNDIILDFFAGSGTTAHAVMDLNAEDEGNRKWICVQLPEATEEDSDAYKAGYQNIADISRERIRRAGKKIGKGDTGFKSFQLSSSNYRKWNDLTSEDDIEELKRQSKLFIEKPLMDGYDEKLVVYEILEKEGFGLNAKVEQEKSSLKPWVVAEGERKLIVTFSNKVTKEDVEELKLTAGDIFVCFDNALDDTTKVNIERNINLKVV